MNSAAWPNISPHAAERSVSPWGGSMLDTIYTWQTLIGGVLGGLFALSAALIVAWRTERRQDLASAMLVTSTLVSVKAAFRNLDSLFAEENATAEDWPAWLSHKLVWMHPSRGPSFEASATRIYPLSTPMAAHIDLFQTIYGDVENRLERLRSYMDDLGETEITDEQKQYVQANSRVIANGFSTAAKHAECAEVMISDLILSKRRHWNRLRMRFWPSRTQQECLKMLGVKED